MGFWRDLFRRTPDDQPAPADTPLEEHVLSGPSEVEQLEGAEDDARRPEDGGLTSPPGETW